MSKKWYSYFVVTDETNAKGDASQGGADLPVAARRVEDVVSTAATTPGAAPLVTTAAAVSAADLAMVYDSARIAAPSHGYTVLKVAEMLHSEHLRELPSDVRRKSVLAALDAAGVKLEDVLQDAVRRDQALDTYERVLLQNAEQLAAKVAGENRQLEEEIARRVAELRAQIDENVRRLAAEQADVEAWSARKRQEEALIADTVGHFVSENPITVAPRAPRPSGDADVR